MVWKTQHPSTSVGRRPNPVNALVRLGRLAVPAVRVRLIDLDQRVRHRRTRAIEQADAELDVLAGRVRSGDSAQRDVGGQAEVEERTDRLRRGRDQACGARSCALFERRRLAAAQDDVEAIAERPFRLGEIEIEARHHAAGGRARQGPS